MNNIQELKEQLLNEVTLKLEMLRNTQDDLQREIDDIAEEAYEMERLLDRLQ